MGRFKDLWATGKFATLTGKEEPRFKNSETLTPFEKKTAQLTEANSSNTILTTLKSRRGEETRRWLQNLVPAKAEQRKPRQAGDGDFDFSELVSWINSLFKEFDELVFVFNKTAMSTDFVVSYNGPKVLENQSDDAWLRSSDRIYQGRLTTKQWGLVVRGKDKKISIIMLPSTMVLAFNVGEVSEADFSPFMEIMFSDEQGYWTVGGEPLPAEAIPYLAKELFGDLVRVSTGVMSESELFATRQDQLQPGENTAVGYVLPQSKIADTTHAMQSHDLDTVNIFEACDLVDHVVDREVKRLYQEIEKQNPVSPASADLRKQISDWQALRTKMLAAFEEFTQTSSGAGV